MTLTCLDEVHGSVSRLRFGKCCSGSGYGGTARHHHGGHGPAHGAKDVCRRGVLSAVVLLRDERLLHPQFIEELGDPEEIIILIWPFPITMILKL